MEYLTIVAVVLVIVALVGLIASFITQRNKLFLASLLALALGMAFNAVYHASVKDYAWMAFDLVLVAVNVGNFFWNRSVQRRRATIA